VKYEGYNENGQLSTKDGPPTFWKVAKQQDWERLKKKYDSVHNYVS
jgi:hypothetical protein